MKFSVDLNCDIGESYFDKIVGNDSAIMPYISSCNIACGMHGGDPLTIQTAIDLALKNNVNIGAHPSFPDLENFGRKFMHLSEDELKACLRFQIGAVNTMINLKGGKLRHVKPHGALYNTAATDVNVSKIIVTVLKEFGDDLVLLGMADSEMESVAKEFNVPFVAEVFADRNYTDSGALVARSLAHAVIEDKEEVVQRCLKMVKEKIILSDSEKELNISGQSICVHGDTSNAVALVKSLNSSFVNNGILIQAF